ncbi:hypothetical protein GCM10027592_31880 [Spirosoma flavus]
MSLEKHIKFYKSPSFTGYNEKINEKEKIVCRLNCRVNVYFRQRGPITESIWAIFSGFTEVRNEL